MADTFWLPVEQLTLPPNIPAGMNPLVVMSLTYLMRTTAGWPDGLEEIAVRRTGIDQWSITNGKHRFVAAVMAGRADVLCQEE